MEFLAILMSGLLTALSPVGLIVEQVTGKQISQRLNDAETLEVRVDNLPAHQILNGKIDRVRIASRGVEIIPNFRIDTLEIETDPLSFNLAKLRTGKRGPGALEQPLQAGIRLVLTEEDVNTALRSPQVMASLQAVINRLFAPPGSTNSPQFEVMKATIDFLGDNRFQFDSKISQTDPQTGEVEISNLNLAFTLKLSSGSQFQLSDPSGSINGEALEPFLLMGFAQGVSQGLNLQRFEKRGLTARFLQLHISTQELEMAVFTRFFAQQPE